MEKLRFKFLHAEKLHDAKIDKMNAKAIMLLEKREKAKAQAWEQKSEARVREVFDRYAFGSQNPKLLKYRLPYIEDLVDSRRWEAT
mmetsp:Transcript_44023/g.58410  ORF Transcript_44023/g.58410 Transcript_44023/m.58410 type:complete len:86 (+) Transcript_44023:471-728(+)|eukprot:CAMPEP_0185597588 /NCGR_PEP_ID=MMETSP0434-20130131/81455_1 /TAXON_ID=626734 ORGANISM="Favella taraikaensis, Strain Fe Narragansett Bay" /NCGR_SAMPLE_ID=MMETSP0434 /ASSEMBLY_ACC=CAM_ASM_000379 /LENGTH=85 /DNA_ID=CAMNT_0028226339 /DNA_START=1268 /DNA_END=1525 /DNA_ORIENTATION=-